MSKEALLGKIVREVDKKGRPSGPPLLLTVWHYPEKVYDGVVIEIGKRCGTVTYTTKGVHINGNRPLQIVDKSEFF